MSLVTACPKPLLSIGAEHQATAFQGDSRTIKGGVDFSSFRQIQASINTDVASASTVGLIRISSGQAVATTLTDSHGRFSLSIAGFDPSAHPNDLYYIEATKGLPSGDGPYNAVGGDAARVRTIARYNSGHWETLTSMLGNAQLTQMTTAVSLVVSLRSNPSFGPTIDASQLIGRVAIGTPQGTFPDSVRLPDAFTSGAHPILPLSTIQQAYVLVADALSKNRDPLRWVALSSADPDHNIVTLPDAPFTVTNISPNPAAALDNITVLGSNFSPTLSDNEVWFADPSGALIQSPVSQVSPDLSKLTVQVPQTAVTGIITVIVKGKTMPGPIFNLAVRDGHSVVDVAGNVYMANTTMNTVSVTQKIPGSTRLGVKGFVTTGLVSPSALTFGKNGLSELYVAGSTLLYKIDASSPTPTAVASSSAAPWSHPSGIAYQYSTGDFFIADSSKSKLYKMSHNGATPTPVEFTVTGVTLNKPKGLSFGPKDPVSGDEILYVANSGLNNVLAIDVATGVGTEFLSGLSSPYGLAFDNKYNFYVSNNTGNSVYTRTVKAGAPYPPNPLDTVTPDYDPIQAFASIPTPGGMDADSSGMLFVADNVTNGIYRINQNAETYQVAYGLNYPLSTWVDATGQYILTNAGRIIKVDTSGLLSVFAEGLPSAMGLVRDTKGNFYTFQSNIHTLTQVRSDGSAVPFVTGLTSCSYTDTNIITTGLNIVNDKIYLRQAASFDTPSPSYPGQGDVIEFTLVADGNGAYTSATGPVPYHEPIDKLNCISYNDTNSTYYVVQPRTGTIFTVTRAGSTATFAFLRTDARLTSPLDIWVDSTSGLIWVINDDGGTGNLYIYNADGTNYTNGGANPTGDYSASVDHPTHLNSDATRLYVNSYKAAGDIRELNRTTGAVTRTITGFNNPRGFGFDAVNNVLYVNEWSNGGRLLSLANYPATVGPGTPLLTIGNYTDLEMVGSCIYASSGGGIYRFQFDGSVWARDGIAWRLEYFTVGRIAKTGNGHIIGLTSQPALIDANDGSYYHWTSSLSDIPGWGGYDGLIGDPTGSGVVLNGYMYAYSRLAGPSSTIAMCKTDGTQLKTFNVGSINGSGITTNGVDTVYVSMTNSGTIYKIVGGVMSPLSSAPYGGGDRMYGGISYYGGFVYEAVYNRHWIDTIDATTGQRKTLYQGLVAPEL